MDFSLCQLDKGEIWEATCWRPVSIIRSVWVPINFSHGSLSLIQRRSPTLFPILRSRGRAYTPPLRRYPYEGFKHLEFCTTHLEIIIPKAKNDQIREGRHVLHTPHTAQYNGYQITSTEQTSSMEEKITSEVGWPRPRTDNTIEAISELNSQRPFSQTHHTAMQQHRAGLVVPTLFAFWGSQPVTTG